MNEVKAIAKNVKGSPRKARIVADQVRGKNALYAVEALKYMQKGAATSVRKAVESAIANAVNNKNLSAQNLVITKIVVDAAPMYKRQRAESKGRARLILKRNSHITVYVADTRAGAAMADVMPAMPVEAEVIENKDEAKVEEKPVAKKPAAKKAPAKKATAAKKPTKKVTKK
jgi:large subunit ribosomal protein L22